MSDKLINERIVFKNESWRQLIQLLTQHFPYTLITYPNSDYVRLVDEDFKLLMYNRWPIVVNFALKALTIKGVELPNEWEAQRDE